MTITVKKRRRTLSRIERFAREVGLTLHPGQAEVATEFDEGGFNEAVWQIGRRWGKTTLADLFLLEDVVLRDHLRKHLRRGELRVAGVICPRLEQSSEHIENLKNLIAVSPRLRAMLVSETGSELRFSNDAAIRAYPCSARGIRGGAWSSVLLDEFSHFVDSENGNASGDAVLQAVKPALAQFGFEGRLIAISTPRWKLGAFNAMVERAQSGRFPRLHYAHRATADNPRIDPLWLEEEKKADPDLYAREYLAQPNDGVSAYLQSADVIASKRSTGILPPQEGTKYYAMLDPSYMIDSFAMGIGHRDADGRTIIDGVWTWHRYGHAATLDAVHELAMAYHRPRMSTDQHCAVPVREGLEARGIDVEYRPWSNESKADAFAALKVGLNTRSLELPDDAALIEELCSLEAKATPAGFTRIAAAPGAHDDRAVVVAGVAHALAVRSRTSRLQQGYARAALAAANRRAARPPVNDAAFAPTRSSGGRDSWFGSQGDTGWPS